ncbi:MAG: DUF6265 family protein [Planctomycetota bacterium]
MHLHNRFQPSFVFLALITLLNALSTASILRSQEQGVAALDGEWVFVEDRTEGREPENQQPSTSAKLRLRVEADAVVLIRSDGEVRMRLDGEPTDVEREGRRSRYRGIWKDGQFEYEVELLRATDGTRSGLLRFEFRPTSEGLLARAMVDPPNGMNSLALYRKPADIPLPTSAKATIDGIGWLAGAWVGTSGTNGSRSIEERWSPPLGGSMLAVSRTVSRGRTVAFEYLRVLERDGGLVYIAQPNGAPPTTFTLTELSDTRAVFENPRHDFPQRIIYELSAEGGLSASIGYGKGGRPRRFEFKPEDSESP